MMATLELQIKILGHALNAMEEKPGNLKAHLEFFGLQSKTSISVNEIVQHVGSDSGLDDPIKLAFHRALAGWDYQTNASWTDTDPNTAERRALIYDLLKLNDSQRKVIDEHLPYYAAEQPIVIAAEHQRWFTQDVEARGFYWKAYKDYLEKSGWNHQALLALDTSTREVVERLSDPTRSEAFQSKGLVVGYVQSGKTANFTGVVARAADAGYRLIVVLTGMTEILRRQTQRRLDKEMIGREFLDHDYENDAEFEKFISHGNRPSQLGYYDWQRLTGPEYDYKSLKRGIDALEFEKVNPSKPFYAAENLRIAKARLIVIKKNSTIMNKVIGDLGRIRSRLGDIPVLIVDDESDQASINTRPADKQRAAVNNCIVQLLKILPRAQYVGYTATPFANVLVDPSLPEDLFPKDFLLGLPRPPGYMGVSDFYDLDRQPPYDAGDLTSKRACFVRPVVGDDVTVPSNLQMAIDSFILAGAIKLFRQSKGVALRGIDHHTMLVHVSHRKSDHEQHVATVDKVLKNSDYRGGDAYDRLRRLYDRDFLPVTKARAPEMPLPSKFGDLSLNIGETLSRLAEGGKQVLMVNSDADADTPDFDAGRVWKIIVGGTKLSRGYTVEGLTVSYYRRSAKTADTLMQMGRWFGFRLGYSDIVRLFIGTAEPVGRTETIDLYEAFGAVCRDEEMFREQLKQYASIDDPRVLPIQIPPLVPSHMLRPTSKNKMFNARVMNQNLKEEWAERTMLPVNPNDIAQNVGSFLRMLQGTKLHRNSVSFDLDNRHESFEVVWADVGRDRLSEFLRSYRWLGSNQNLMKRELDFLNGTGDRDPEIDRCLMIAPQRKKSRSDMEWDVDVNGYKLSEFERNLVAGQRVGAITEPLHRIFAEYAALGRRKDNAKPQISAMSLDGRKLHKPKQAVMLVYPIKTHKKGPTQLGFSLFFPANHIVTPLVFGVSDQHHRDAATITART